MSRSFGGTTSDKIQFPNSSAINISGTALSVFCRFRKADTGTRRYLYGKSGASASPFAYGMRVDASNQIVFLVDAGAGTFDNAASTTTVSANTWYTALGVKNGTGGNAISVYVNGSQQGSSVSNVTLASNTNDLVAGYRDISATSEIWSGDIAELAIWNVALTAAEAVALDKGVSPLLIRPQSLQFYAPLGGRASPEQELRNGNGGTVTGTSAGEHPRVLRPTRGQVGKRRTTTYLQSVAGTLASAGSLIRRTGKPLAGTVTASGALLKRAAKGLAGTLTSSGTLATARVVLKAIGGTLTSAGALSKRTSTALAGTLSGAGALAKRTAKSAAGTLTTSGSLSGVRLFVKAIAGTLTSAGSLAKRTSKLTSGTLTSSGSLIKRTARSLAGTLSPSGALGASRVLLKAVGGTLTSAGALTKRTGKLTGGTLSGSGSLTKRTGKLVSGTLATAGALTKRTSKAIGGTLTSAGSLLRDFFLYIAFGRTAALTVAVPPEARSTTAARTSTRIAVPPETRSAAAATDTPRLIVPPEDRTG